MARESFQVGDLTAVIGDNFTVAQLVVNGVAEIQNHRLVIEEVFLVPQDVVDGGLAAQPTRWRNVVDMAP